jgi:uncharacterized protein YprB with RNaseH-like and TPR domain
LTPKFSSRILLWDIETSDLDPHWGTILCIGYKWLGEKKVHLISVRDFETAHFDDKGVVQGFREVLETADIEVTHNGTLFDKPFLQSRMLYKKNVKGLPVTKHYLPQIAPVDTYMASKSKLRGSKALDKLARFLGCNVTKTRVEPEVWLEAQRGDKKALKYVEDHCVKDVLVLEEVYLKVRPMMKRHPKVGAYGTHSCGSRHFQSRGTYSTTSKGLMKRFECQGCGGWFAMSEKDVAKYLPK